MLPVYLDITDKAKNIINKNIWYMFDLLKATCEGLSYEEVLDGIFPQYILDIDLDKCIRTVKELSNMTVDRYEREYLSPFYEWTLYHTILWWIDVADDIELDEIPRELCITDTGSDLYETINKVDNYFDFMFADWDFLYVDRLYDLYKSNPNIINKFLHIDISSYLELMPNDIREECRILKEEYARSETVERSQEEYIIKTIYTFLQLEALKAEKYTEQAKVKLDEVDLSDNVRNGLFQLYNEHGLTIEREARAGYAIKDLGELDFYIYSMQDDIYKMIAVGENKKWGEYEDSIGQLLGYMDNNTTFGFTIIYNQDTYLHTVINGRKKILQEFSVEGNFKVVGEIEELDSVGMKDVLRTKHENPEKPGTYFNLYHFIFNVHKPQRALAARVSRKRGRECTKSYERG